MADAVFAELFLSRQECKDFAKIRESVQESVKVASTYAKYKAK